jgi:hypothetical protein
MVCHPVVMNLTGEGWHRRVWSADGERFAGVRTVRVHVWIAVAVLGASVGTTACATLEAREDSGTDVRRRAIAEARLWTRTDIHSMNMKLGPRVKGALPFRAIVQCDYLNQRLAGNSPKFACDLGDGDEVKVKFGGANGEVYGEVLATRLLWALGFGADAMFPVNVVCRGCPDELNGILRQGNERRFDPAVIERRMAGTDWPSQHGSAWSWKELDEIVPGRRGAPRAQRDALKLLAVFLQHSDSKPEQQRMLCMDPPHARNTCASPFLMINDLGLTFGRASRTNSNSASSVNLEAWRNTPVWKDAERCVGNLPKSLSGTLDDPVISEEGRRFLAGLLGQITDLQIKDLFEVGRVELRLRDPDNLSSGFATVGEWTAAFKQKRSEITNRRCI